MVTMVRPRGGLNHVISSCYKGDSNINPLIQPRKHIVAGWMLGQHWTAQNNMDGFCVGLLCSCIGNSWYKDYCDTGPPIRLSRHLMLAWCWASACQPAKMGMERDQPLCLFVLHVHRSPGSSLSRIAYPFYVYYFRLLFPIFPHHTPPTTHHQSDLYLICL